MPLVLAINFLLSTLGEDICSIDQLTFISISLAQNFFPQHCGIYQDLIDR